MNLNDLKIPSLAERALLVRLKRNMYQPYAYDSGATALVEANTGVRRAGRFNKRLLLDCYDLKDTNAAFNDVYQYVNHNTVPWLDDGVRMLPSHMYFEFTQGVRELIATAEGKARNLASKWDLLVQRDLARLGPLGDINDYPSDIGSRFGIGLKFMPVPSTADFRVQISQDDMQSLNDAILEAEAGITKHLISEMLEPVRKAVEKLSIPIGQEGAIFRDSLLGNIMEQVQRAHKLNINNDPSVTKMIDDINAAISGYANAQDRLREDVGARSDAQAKLADIMSKMSGMF